MPIWLSELGDSFLRIMKSISFVDLLDIVCVAVLFYYVYKFIRDRRAGKLAIGVVFILGFLLLSDLVEMHALRFLLQNFVQVGMIALVIVFQPELRSALEKVGGESLRGIRSIAEAKTDTQVVSMLDTVCSAIFDMSASKTGALIVFERSTKLGDLILTGTVINADPTPFLIKNIFFNKAPLHDGALIIRDFRLYAAGCLLPLSTNPDIIKDLGTRHRAAIGMSENSDAVVVVVSEETGTVSVAYEGKLRSGFTPPQLSEYLRGFFVTTPPGVVTKARFRLTRGKKKSMDDAANGGDAHEKK